MSNNSGEEECLDNWPATNGRSQREANTTTDAASKPADERRSTFTIRTPLILQARVSKSNWFEPSIKTKVDLFQNILQYSNSGSRSPYFNEEDSQPGITSNVGSRRKDIKTMHGDSGKNQSDLSIKTFVSPQGSKRKIANGNNLSTPTSKRLLCSAKKNSTKRNQKKLDKPQTKSLLLNRSRSTSKIIVKKENSTKSKISLKTNHPSDNISSISKSYSTPKIAIPNVPIYQDTVCTCSNRQRSQSNRSSKTKSVRKSKKRRKSSKSSTKRPRQSRTSVAKRRKSKKTSAKSRKSNTTSKSRTQSKQRRSTKNKAGPRNSRIERTGVKSKRNEARGERIATKRESKAKRLQLKKTEPLKVKLKETLKEKETFKRTTLDTKRRFVSRKHGSKNKKNTNAVRDAEVCSGKVSDINHPPDVSKLVDKIESLREQGDSYNTPKKRIVTTNADVEIQCCLLTPSQCFPNNRAQSVTNESINSNNFVNESSPFGEHLVRTQESKIRNLDEEALGETEQRVVNINGETGVNSQCYSLTLNPDLSLRNSGGAFSVMKEQAENSTSFFGQLGGHNGYLSEENGRISNLDGQATTRKEIERLINVNDQTFVCSQSHPLTLSLDLETESRNADMMEKQIKNPSNSFNDSRELNEHLSSSPEERSRNFDLKSFIQNETKENVQNIDDYTDKNSQSNSMMSAQYLQFDPGIDSEPMETRGNSNNCFEESSEQFSNLPEKSSRNLDEQMDVRNTIKECLMIIDEPVEARQYNFQSFTIPNLPIQSGVAVDMAEETENSSKLSGQWNGFTTRELQNEINSKEQTDPNNKKEQSLLNTDDQTESQSYSTESFQSLSPTPSSVAKDMTLKEKKGSVRSLNEPKRLTEQISDLPDKGSTYLINEQINTNCEIEQCSTNVYDDQAKGSQPHFKTSAQNLALADAVAKVMKENIQSSSSSQKLNEHVEQLPKPTENINRDSNQQVNNKFQKSPLSFKLQKTQHGESMALLPYEPSRFMSPPRENETSGFLSNESDGFNEQFSNSPEESTNINEVGVVGVSLLELVSLSLSQSESPKDITYSPDQIQEIESQIRTLRCIYIQESDSIHEDELESEISSAEDGTVPVNYNRPSMSLILEGLPNWLKYLYNNLFRSKK